MLKLLFPMQGSPENNDRWVHQIVFPFKKRGFYVELGAADGVTGSSCYVLEKIGWQGICVEPCSAFFPALCRNRPKAICENICVGERSGQVRFREIRGYLSRIIRQPKYEFHRHERFMPCLTLVDLLAKHGAPPVIDYLAMDCEGSDGWLLNAFDFNAYQILAISMEGDEAGPSHR